MKVRLRPSKPKAELRLLKNSILALVFLCGLLSGFDRVFVASERASARGTVNVPIPGMTGTHFVAAGGSDDGPGTAERPWATINHAAEEAKAGDTIVVHGGQYVLPSQVRPRNSGRESAWITYIGAADEKVVLDAHLLSRRSMVRDGLDNGVFQIERIAYVRVANLTIINARGAGFTIRDSSHVDLLNNSTEGTFSSGIAVWDTLHDGHATRHIRILGNTVKRATSWDSAFTDLPRNGEPPHEAISLGGAVEFEVAYNHVYDSNKEGIDIKETSKRGRVHHNLVQGVLRQGIYIDAWFGTISDIEVYDNVIHDCGGAGIALSVENGVSIDGVRIQGNLIFNNAGSGLFFSRWGVDGSRRNVTVLKNIFYHNGYGEAAPGQEYYWLTGGLYLYSTAIYDLAITNNIFSDNRGFQIGFSELFLEGGKSWSAARREKGLRIAGNLVNGRNTIGSPVESGGNPADRLKIYATSGQRAIFADPMFKDPASGDFTARHSSPALVSRVALSIYGLRAELKPWWIQGFPPRLEN
jgi:hypothetical protein